MTARTQAFPWAGKNSGDRPRAFLDPCKSDFLISYQPLGENLAFPRMVVEVNRHGENESA
jgi:hypothetical protein